MAFFTNPFNKKANQNNTETDCKAKTTGKPESGTQNEASTKSNGSPSEGGDCPKKKVYNLIIIDESGSMSGIQNTALSGTNETIQTIRTSQQEDSNLEHYLTLVTFNSGRDYIKTHYSIVPIDNVKELSTNDYNPNGYTALYDAIGESVTTLAKQIGETDAALVTIITDGYENSSRKYNAESIKQLISSFESRNWVFTYLGANQDSMLEAGRIGIQNSMNWDCTEVGAREMWREENASRKQFFADYSKNCCCKRTGYFTSKENRSRRHQFDCGITPRHITHLLPNEVFVFGSNIQGQHTGGAAAQAYMQFGAIMGQPLGMQGQSYAIPTVGVTLDALAMLVSDFIEFAKANPDRHFYVTAIGCGSAGYTPDMIAPLFKDAVRLKNISLPMEFIKSIQERP